MLTHHLTLFPLLSLMKLEYRQLPMCWAHLRPNELVELHRSSHRSQCGNFRPTGQVGLSLLCAMSLSKTKADLRRRFSTGLNKLTSLSVQLYERHLVKTPFFAYVGAGSLISISHKLVPTSGLEKQLILWIFNHLYVIEQFQRQEKENTLPRMSQICLLSLASRRWGTWTKIWPRQNIHPNGYVC